MSDGHVQGQGGRTEQGSWARGCAAPWRQVQQQTAARGSAFSSPGPSEEGDPPGARRGTVHRPGAPLIPSAAGSCEPTRLIHLHVVLVPASPLERRALWDSGACGSQFPFTTGASR